MEVTSDLRGIPGLILDRSLNSPVEDVALHGRKTSTSISVDGSLYTLSTGGCVNSGNKREETEREQAFSQKAAFETGHILTELTAAAWYSYVLIYFQNVVNLSPTGTGLVFLISQIVRAGSTLVLVFGLDEDFWRRFAVYGSNKARHILGSAAVLFSWPLVFAPCIFDSAEDPEVGTVTYYLIPVLVFSIGWPLVEASHEAIVTDSAKSDQNFIGYHLSRSELRHGCSMCLYATAWFLLQESSVQEVDMRTQQQFVRLSLLIVPSGFIFVLIFHCAMGDKLAPMKSSRKEKQVLKGYIAKDVPLLTIRYKKEKPSIFKIWKNWQKHPQFYKIGAVYLCSQILLYTSSMYFPLFLTQTLRLPKESIASYPLIVVITGHMTNLARSHATKRLGIKLTLMGAAVISFGASVWFYYLNVPQRFLSYVAVVLFSCGTSLVTYTAAVLLTGLRMIDRDSGGNTVGALAFVDRTILGVVVLFVQLGHPETLNRSSAPGNILAGNYFQTVFSLIPAVSAAMLLVIAALFLHRQPPGQDAPKKGRQESGEDGGDKRIHHDGLEKLQVDVSTKNYYEDAHPAGRKSLVLQAESTGILRALELPIEENQTIEQAQPVDHAEELSTVSSIVSPAVLPKEMVSPDNGTNSLDLTSQGESASSTVSTCTTTDEIRKTVRSASPALQGFYEFPKPMLSLSAEHVGPETSRSRDSDGPPGPVVHIVTLDMSKLRNASLMSGPRSPKHNSPCMH